MAKVLLRWTVICMTVLFFVSIPSPASSRGSDTENAVSLMDSGAASQAWGASNHLVEKQPPLPPSTSHFARQERISDFQSTLRVTPDGLLMVEERLVFSLPNNTNYHGLFRDIPVTSRFKRGFVPLVVHSVTLDGRDLNPEDHEMLDNHHLRIFMRDPDQTLDRGDHLFVLTYSLPHQIGFYDQYDELNWNVTGSDWAFPILHARASISLPNGASIKQTAGWTGKPGSRESAVLITPHANSVFYSSEQILLPGEGLTVAVSWPKQIVTAVPDQTAAVWFQCLPSAIFLLLLLYFCTAWWKYGKDPRPGACIPRFYPPDMPGALKDTPMSPAAVGFMQNKGSLDARAFAAFFIGMAQRGVCTIQGTAKTGFTLFRGQGRPFYPEERAVAPLLPHANAALNLKQGNHSTLLGKIRSKVEHNINATYAPFWEYSVGVSFMGLLLTVGLVTGYAWAALGDFLFSNVELLIWVGLWCLELSLFTLLLCNTVLFWRQGKWFRLLVLFLVVLLLGALVALLLEIPLTSFTPLEFVPLALSLAIPFLFYPHMRAPSVEGQRLRDAISGLALYIATAEEAQLNMLNPPDRTPELYQRLLPYAVALSLERAWGAKFTEVLADACSASETAYSSTAFVHAFSQQLASYSGNSGSTGSRSAFSSRGGGAGSGGGGGGGGAC